MDESTMKKHMNDRFGNVFNYQENPALPQSLNIELNNSCNQKCVFCPFHGKYAPSVSKITYIDYKTVTQILDQAYKLGIGEKEVGFYLSGEAFLYQRLPEVILYAKKLGYKYTFITSNGALATPDKMRRVLDAGLDSIRFSINAADRKMYQEIHGTDDFNKVIDNLQFMHEYIKKNNLKVVTSLSCVITKKTIGIQDKIKEIFGKYVDDILFIPVILNRLECSQEFIREYQIMDDTKTEIKKDFVCPMLFDTMYINAHLEVVPCCEAYDVQCCFYDLKKDFNLENAWNCIKYKQYRKIFLDHADVSGTICENCVLRMKGVERLSLQ